MHSDNHAPNQPTPQRLFQMAFAYAAPLMIEAALEHRVFDILDGGAKSVDEVANESGASPRGLRALMNGLIALEVVSKDAEGKYSLTPESSTFLVTTKPSFQGGIFRHASTQLIPKWLSLPEIVRTGKPSASVNEQGDGVEFFHNFVEDIFPMSYRAAQTLAGSLDLSGPTRVLDIAAGSGVWGIALSQASPNVRVTAVDWEGVLPVTRRVAEKFGVADRFEFRAGDIGEVDFGEGYNLATLGHILHSEGPARSKQLLKKVHEALALGGTIAIAEMVANAERTGPPHALVFAVNMLVNTEEGDTYSFEEMSDWLREAGFGNPRQLDAPGPSPLILADKAK
jgi:precorrin-6B methylase 2